MDPIKLVIPKTNSYEFTIPSIKKEAIKIPDVLTYTAKTPMIELIRVLLVDPTNYEETQLNPLSLEPPTANYSK
jgi:hypothetical protein